MAVAAALVVMTTMIPAHIVNVAAPESVSAKMMTTKTVSMKIVIVVVSPLRRLIRRLRHRHRHHRPHHRRANPVMD